MPGIVRRIFCYPGKDCPAVFAGGKVDEFCRALQEEFAVQAAAPVIIQVCSLICFQLCLHFQPVGDHSVRRGEDAIEAGENAQMGENILPLRVREDPRGNVLILDSLVGEQSRGKRPVWRICMKPFVILLCKPLAAGSRAFRRACSSSARSRKMGSVSLQG